MQRQDKKNNKPANQTAAEFSNANQQDVHQAALPAPANPKHTNHHCRHDLKTKQLLNGADICSRFEQVCGKGLPKRMTTGKFVYLSISDRLPDPPV